MEIKTAISVTTLGENTGADNQRFIKELSETLKKEFTGADVEVELVDSDCDAYVWASNEDETGDYGESIKWNIHRIITKVWEHGDWIYSCGDDEEEDGVGATSQDQIEP